MSSNSQFYITPDELIYNFQTFAEITEVTPNIGSKLGGTEVTIRGRYFYHSDLIPAQVMIAGKLILFYFILFVFFLLFCVNKMI